MNDNVNAGDSVELQVNLEDPAEKVSELYNKVHSTKIALAEQLEQAKIELARVDFDHFIEYVMKDSHSNRGMKLSAVHKSWTEHIRKYEKTHYDIGILAPWGYGKSTIIAIARVLFLLGQNRNLRIGIVCNNDNNAMKRLTAVAEYITGSPEYHAVFPRVKPGDNKAWSSHRIIVERDVIAPEGSVEAHGIEGGGTGSRYDVLLLDDPVDNQDAMSEATRKARIEKYTNVWSSRVEPHGKTYYIATRWHKHDLTHELLQKDTFKFIVQAVTDDFSKIIEPPAEYRHYISVERRDKPRFIAHWNEKWSKEELKTRAGRLGLRAFNRGLRQRPYSDEDTLFKEDAVRTAAKWDLDVLDCIVEGWPTYMGVDLASDKRPGTVLIVIARSPATGKKVVCEVRRGRWGFSSRTAEQVKALHDKWKCRLIYVENNSAQETMLALIKEKYGIDMPVKGYTTGRSKADPMEGLPGMAVEFENGVWTIPLQHVKGEESYLASSEVPDVVLVRELIEFPHGSEYDTVMALWFANHAAKAGRGITAPGIYEGSGNKNMFQAQKYQFGSGYKSERNVFGKGIPGMGDDKGRPL